jgi:CRP-like cAMP-binding protein
MKDILFKYMSKFTNLTQAEQQVIMEDLVIEECKKGTVLLRQGEIPTRCYFVLKGCIRQYAIDEDGNEVTSNFYTEEQAIVPKADHPSAYSFTCLEDSLLVNGDFDIENDMFDKYTQLESMTRKMTEENFIQLKDDFAEFIASTPEERFKALLQKRPDLIKRVPQHQLASYLGITPESLSRIKKRVIDKQ